MSRRDWIVLSIVISVAVVAASVALYLTRPKEPPPVAITEQQATAASMSKEEYLSLARTRYDEGAYLGRYYLDVKGTTDGPVTRDEEAAFKQPWEPQIVEYEAGSHATAGTNAMNGLHDFSRFVATGDKRFLKRAISTADWMITQQSSDGSWVYSVDYEEMKAPWISAMDQGLGISLLTRVYQETDDKKYLDAARKAYLPLTMPVSRGGTVGTFPDGSEVLEEYPGAVKNNIHVLNGAIFATFGVADLGRVTGDRKINAHWWRLQKNLAANLAPGYTTEDWTFYSDRRATTETFVANLNYMKLHIVQAKAMYLITNDARWKNAADTWYRYVVTSYQKNGGQAFR